MAPRMLCCFLPPPAPPPPPPPAKSMSMSNSNRLISTPSPSTKLKAVPKPKPLSSTPTPSTKAMTMPKPDPPILTPTTVKAFSATNATTTAATIVSASPDPPAKAQAHKHQNMSSLQPPPLSSSLTEALSQLRSQQFQHIKPESLEEQSVASSYQSQPPSKALHTRKIQEQEENNKPFPEREQPEMGKIQEQEEQNKHCLERGQLEISNKASNEKPDAATVSHAELHEVEKRFSSLVVGIKSDLARELGYPLALHLIQEVSFALDPSSAEARANVRAGSHPTPWGWLNMNYEFKKALADYHEKLPPAMRSTDGIASSAVQIVYRSNNGKHYKGIPEQLYSNLKNFSNKGYMECLKKSDSDLHEFLSLADFFGNSFIARPRLLQIAVQMLQRVRNDLSIYWNTWEKLPFKWDERWHEAEGWFQTVLDCLKDGKSGVGGGSLPTTPIELAREFDIIEESCRKINGSNQNRDPGSFDQIISQFNDFKESGLLTPEIRKQNYLCTTFLELSPQIKTVYLGIIEAKAQNEEEMRARRESRSNSKSFVRSGSKLTRKESMVGSASRKRFPETPRRKSGEEPAIILSSSNEAKPLKQNQEDSDNISPKNGSENINPKLAIKLGSIS